MRRDRYHKNVKKERIVMGASAVFVLAALTMTGIYVKKQNQTELNDGYQMDYETLESSKEEIESLFPTFPDLDEQSDGISSNQEFDLSADDALDYAPDFQEVDTIEILLPGLTDKDLDTLADEAAMAADARRNSQKDEIVVEEEIQEEVAKAETEVVETPAEPMPTIPANSFVAGEALSWPISGTVLISYSMDKTVFFETLQQYKYNPGMMISASVGDTITSAASGTVVEIGEDSEIGKYVVVDIGNSYKAIYGQLQNIQAYVGGTVDVGSVLGYVAEPTKYFSVEGPNAYFALTKEEEPVDPLAPLW
ncbi:MAG: M23 family metallopeptidase [Lachnospiraceae bacterium]|nr:M23 family metallopeptidase [Lachnospiraceae bacterium]